MFVLRQDLRSDLWVWDNGDAGFSSKEALLDKDTHVEMPREGWGDSRTLTLSV